MERYKNTFKWLFHKKMKSSNHNLLSIKFRIKVTKKTIRIQPNPTNVFFVISIYIVAFGIKCSILGQSTFRTKKVMFFCPNR